MARPRTAESTRTEEDNDAFEAACEEEEEEDEHQADRIAELDELGLQRWGPELLEPIERKCIGALALIRGKSFAGQLRRELQGSSIRNRSLMCRYPLGADELRTVFAFNKHKALLEVTPGAPPASRVKRREAERAKEAAEAAAPEVLSIIFFEDVDALMRTALPHCSALRLGEPLVPLRPKTSSDFANEVAMLDHGGLFKLVSYVPSKAGSLVSEPVVAPAPAPAPPEAPPMDCALIREWVEGGLLTSRLAHKRRIQEREVLLWGVSLAAALVAVHRGGYVFNGPTPDLIQLSKRGPWPADARRHKKLVDEYLEDLEARKEEADKRRELQIKLSKEPIKEKVIGTSLQERAASGGFAAKFKAREELNEKRRRGEKEEETIAELEPLRLPPAPDTCYDAFLKDLDRCTPRDIERDPLLSFEEAEAEKLRKAREALAAGEDGFVEHDTDESDGDTDAFIFGQGPIGMRVKLAQGRLCVVGVKGGAEARGIRVGDAIDTLNGERLTNVSEAAFAEKLRGRPVALTVTRASPDPPSRGSRSSRHSRTLERAPRPQWCPEGYEPPEGFTILGTRSDAWLLGCLLWELATRKRLSLQERVCLPRLTPTQEASTLLKWRVAEGCAYDAGDALCDIETEGKTLHVTADTDGVVATYLSEAGATVDVGDALYVRGDCLALKDVPLDKALRQVPARFGAELKNCLRAALEPDPRERATCEELFYLLEPARAKRRHAVIELRPRIAELAELDPGGYAEAAPPLAGRKDREAAAAEKKRVAAEKAEETALATTGQNPETTPEQKPKPKVKLISALLAARFAARGTKGDDGGELREADLTEAQLMQRRRSQFEASLSPEALVGWKRALERVEAANRKRWYDNLPGVRRRRVDRKRARILRVREHRKKIKLSKTCALVTFWPARDVEKWAKLACRRAVDCEALRLLNRDGWYKLQQQRIKERAASERAKHRRARHAKLAALKKGEAPPPKEEEEEVEVAKEEDTRKSIMGRQVIPPAETKSLLHGIDEARRSRDDQRRRLRKQITEGLAERKLQGDRDAAEAAIALVWLDHAALRYCEPLGACLVARGVTGKKLAFVMNKADENAERGVKRLQVKGELEDRDAVYQALAVAAVARSEVLKEVLLESVILAERMRAPPKVKNESDSSDSSDDDENKIDPEAHAERDRQAFVLALVLYSAFHETKTKSLPAREDSSARIQSMCRGRQTRTVITEIWRQADILADDELRADAAAKAALAAEEARKPKPLPPPPPALETLVFGARYAVLGLGSVLRKVGARAAQATKGRSDDPLAQTTAEPLSIIGWKGVAPPVDDSTCPHVLYFELGPLADDDANATHPEVEGVTDVLAARVDELRPATTYLVVLKMTPRTRLKMVRACGRGEGATRVLPPEDDDENLQTRCVSFRTLSDCPDPPRAPRVRALRFRGAGDLAKLIAPQGSTKDNLRAMGAAIKPPDATTVAVKVVWTPPDDNGARIRGYRIERAKAFRAYHRAPLAPANWTQVRAVDGNERDITDVAPVTHRLWWYRIVCHNKVGVSEPGVASKIDLTDAATELHPHLRPLLLETEAPAPAPLVLMEASVASQSLLMEATVASRASALAQLSMEAAAPPAPAPEADPFILSERPLPKLKRAAKRSGPSESVINNGVFFTVLNTAKPLPPSKGKSTFR